MSWSGLKTRVEEFFFRPVSPYPAAVFRILFGLCVCATLLLLHADWLNWFGVHGWISMSTIVQAETGFRLNLFEVVPADDQWITGLFWLLLASGVSLTLGLGTRISSVVVFLGLNSLNQRMPLILHGGDTFLRSASFFLMFASCGRVLSLDSLIRSGGGRVEGRAASLISPWPLRLIQVQLAIVYLASFWWKAKGNTWWDGTALFYVVHLREVRQFPVPAVFFTPWILRFGGWTVMAFELLFPLLIWFRRFQRPVLLTGLLFHLCLEYTLNIPMFQWDILSAYVLFLDWGVQSRLSARDTFWLNSR